MGEARRKRMLGLQVNPSVILANLDTELMVDGIKLMRPAPPENGVYTFVNPYSNQHVVVKDERVAAACEFVLGASVFGGVLSGETLAAFDKLKDYIYKHDVETYRNLID